jgi:predicted PurR-regulated permease PerM
MKDKTLSRYFLITVLVASIIASVLLFRPFLIEIVIAAVIASVFYGPYLWLTRILRGKRKIASLLMCLFLLLVVIVPILGLIIFTAQKSVGAYSELVSFINTTSDSLKNSFLNDFEFIDLESEVIKDSILKLTKSLSDWMVNSAATIVKSTTSFSISLILILLTMFFFFVDGERMLKKLRTWSPLPNKYDMEIFKKFREVSYTSMISTFVTAGFQGIVGVIGFIIAGLPAFYPGILIGFFSLIPYPGSMIIYVPIGIYLILAGQVAKGIFILAWGAFIIGNTDNIIRAYILRGKGKSRINPIFILFSLFGGMALFGFWGLVLGPLILSLVVTVFHIYEIEYSDSLEK